MCFNLGYALFWVLYPGFDTVCPLTYLRASCPRAKDESINPLLQPLSLLVLASSTVARYLALLGSLHELLCKLQLRTLAP